MQGTALAKKLQPIADSLLHRGEELRGVIAASSKKVLGGRAYVLVVTDKRLVIQHVSRLWEPIGRPIPVHPDEIAAYELRGMAEGALRGPLSRLSRGGFILEITTTDGRPIQLMGWTGKGPMGAMGGGDHQSEGVAALDAWLEALDFES